MEEVSHHEKKTKGIASAIEIALIGIWSVFFFLFPLIISTHTTNGFILPKQMLLIAVVLVSLLLWGIKIVAESSIRIRRTPFDMPILLFSIVLLISSIISVNKFDALSSFVAFFAVALGYFFIVNVSRKQNAVFLFLFTLLLSACSLSVLTIFSYIKIYLLPFNFSHVPTFTLFGSLLEQAYYFAFILPIAGFYTYPLLKGKVEVRNIIFSSAFVLILLGLIFTILQVFTMQKTYILPFETGFQIAFAAISQDTGRIFQGFFFGSGFGTFANDFTRFKLLSFNQNQDIWYLVFNQSSSLVLELLTTTGILGFLSFGLILFKIVKRSVNMWDNPLSISLLVAIVLAFVLPISYTSFALFFFLIALFCAFDAQKNPHNFYDLELQAFAMTKRFGRQSEDEVVSTNSVGKFLTIPLLVVILALIGFIGFYGTSYALSDIYFQNSIIAATQNNASATYLNQQNAIRTFPYRDVYYTAFSQTNLAIANSIASSQSKEKPLSDESKKNLYMLIQQSINSSRIAVTLAPETARDWQNLAAIYRSLIGFGQNAEKFTVDSMTIATSLDATNPQEYIALGGIYYQLGQYDNAITQFQTAAKLKPELANAYYNLGHALEQKGQLQDALNQYSIVLKLVSNDPTNKNKMQVEINTLKEKLGTQTQSGQTTSTQGETKSGAQEPLSITVPTSAIPTQSPKKKIPGTPPTPIVKTSPTPTSAQ